MDRRLSFVVLLFILLVLSACQTTATIQLDDNLGQGTPVRDVPVDVQTEFINVQALSPQAIDIDSGNLFANGGFESGLDGWTACSAGAIKTSSDAYEGSGALEVVPSNCFYRSAEVSAGQELILSCYAKILSGSGWTGMGMGFADSSWTTVGEAPATVITGTDYARYDVKFTAPANSKYASMWLYSENPVVIDNCSLMLEAAPPPPPPPPPSGDNLLQNGEFETLDGSSKPTEWSIGCGGSATSVSGLSGRGLELTGGVCIDQGLTASDIAALANQEFTYSCYAKNTGGYASISIFFDGQPTFKQIPVSSDYQLVEIKGTAPQASSGFVSAYSEGGLTLDQCSLTTGDAPPPPPPPPPPSGDNLLENGAFETLNADSKPVNWSKGCSGFYSRVVGRSGNGLSLTGGACVDQQLSSSDLSTLAGQQYTYSCYAKNTGGYASMSIFFDGAPVSTVIPQSNDFQLVEITGTAPSSSSGFVSIYSEGGLTVDDCLVTVEDTTGTTITVVNETKKLVLDNRERNDNFGLATDIKGNVAIVGAPTTGSLPSKLAYIYEKDASGNWSFTTILTPEDPVALFGDTVALSDDSKTAFVGDSFTSKIHVFRKDNNTWMETQVIEGDFRQMKAMDASNNTLVINSIDNISYIYYFDEVTDKWLQNTSFTASSASDITISNNTLALAFGSRIEIYERNLISGAWEFVKSVNGSTEASLYEDTLVVASSNLSSATLENDTIAFVYERNQGGLNNWGLVKTITRTSLGITDGSVYAISVAINKDTTAIGTAASALSSPSRQTSFFILSRNSGGLNNWGAVAEFLPTGTDTFVFPNPQALAIDCGYIIAGVPGADGNSVGAAYLVESPSLTNCSTE